jgi:hypothetical protein
MSQNHCHSCGMPVENGPYCQYCADGSGNLHPFDETVRRMAAFWQSTDSTLTAQAAERKTLEHMAQMPAWKEHPELLERLKG